MIGSLRGKLILKRPRGIIVEAHGVGYEVYVPLSLLSDLPDEGSEVFLFVHTNMKDDSIELYGFSSEREREVFRTLLGVTGVGPRLALNILSGAEVDQLLSAIDSGETGLLTTLPGVGKKTAQRIIFELREKLPVVETEKDRAFDDALAALVSLGYKKSLAREALEKVYQNDSSRSTEELLKETLKVLMR